MKQSSEWRKFQNSTLKTSDISLPFWIPFLLYPGEPLQARRPTLQPEIEQSLQGFLETAQLPLIPAVSQSCHHRSHPHWRGQRGSSRSTMAESLLQSNQGFLLSAKIQLTALQEANSYWATLHQPSLLPLPVTQSLILLVLLLIFCCTTQISHFIIHRAGTDILRGTALLYYFAIHLNLKSASIHACSSGLVAKFSNAPALTKPKLGTRSAL